MKRLVCLMAAVATTTFATAPNASTFSTDISDFWWNAGESGWGINVTLQNDVAFATFYIYDTSGDPVWYSTDLHSSGYLTWSGNLYQEHGQWFGGAFDPTKVKQDKVGTAQFVLTGTNTATLTYTVNGAAVTKYLTRTTWTNENYTGNYAGGFSLRGSNCNPPSLNGVNEDAGYIAISHSGASFSIALSISAGTCSFTGTYSQTGKLGEVVGTYGCSNGSVGTFDFFEITPTISGFNGRMTGQNQYCQWSGYLGGIARAK